VKILGTSGICELGLIKVNLKSKTYIPEKACKQNDTLILDFEMWDGSILADLTGWNCMIKANKNKKAWQVEDAIVSTSTSRVHIECKSTLTQLAGSLLLELFFSNNGLQKTSFNIEIDVEQTVMGNTDGTVPECIITPLENLDKNLAQISNAISQANAVKTQVDASTSTANTANTALNSTINNANAAKASCDTATSNLNTAVNTANLTIDELKQSNTAYTQHINNADIHVTRPEKDKWNAYEARIIELTTIIDEFIYLDAAVTDDDGNNVTDDNNENVIM